jgi:hypothetical protein
MQRKQSSIRVGTKFQAATIPTLVQPDQKQAYVQQRSDLIGGSMRWSPYLSPNAEMEATKFLEGVAEMLQSETAIDHEKALFFLAHESGTVTVKNVYPAQGKSSSSTRAAAESAKAKMKKPTQASTPTKPKAGTLDSKRPIVENGVIKAKSRKHPISKIETLRPEAIALVKKLTGFDLEKALLRDDEVCFLCKDGGDILCCEKPLCKRSYHMVCIDMKEEPQGEWKCRAHTCWEWGCTRGIDRDGFARPCILCAKVWCSEHRQPRQLRRGHIVREVCDDCALLLEGKDVFFEWHLFALHRVLQPESVSIDLMLTDGTKLNQLEFFQATIMLKDDDIDDMNYWTEILTKFPAESAELLQRHYTRIILPYKKLFVDPTRIGVDPRSFFSGSPASPKKASRKPPKNRDGPSVPPGALLVDSSTDELNPESSSNQLSEGAASSQVIKSEESPLSAVSGKKESASKVKKRSRSRSNPKGSNESTAVVSQRSSVSVGKDKDNDDEGLISIDAARPIGKLPRSNSSTSTASADSATAKLDASEEPSQNGSSVAKPQEGSKSPIILPPPKRALRWNSSPSAGSTNVYDPLFSTVPVLELPEPDTQKEDDTSVAVSVSVRTRRSKRTRSKERTDPVSYSAPSPSKKARSDPLSKP